MSDLISRQALQDAMYHEAFETDSDMQKWDSGCWIRYKMFENVVAALPSAQPEQRWIPVAEKEKLPEDEYVLISKKPTKISGDKWSVAIAIRMADPRSGKIQWRDSGFGIIQDDEVLAWMPLPEPWKEGGAEC